MNEFINKLIEGLEENKNSFGGFEDDDFFFGKYTAYKDSISIVNQLAEEYSKTPTPNHPIPIDTQQYIEELEHKLKEKDCSKCSRRSWYQIGYADAEKKLSDK